MQRVCVMHSLFVEMTMEVQDMHWITPAVTQLYIASINEHCCFNDITLYSCDVIQMGCSGLAYPDIYNGEWTHHICGLAQDCSNSIASAMELLQFCANSSIC